PLCAQLTVEESERGDPVLLRGPQQSLARALPCDVVLERDLLEACERVPHVRGVVDRQASLPARVDVGESSVRKTSACGSAEWWHVRDPLKIKMISAGRV